VLKRSLTGPVLPPLRDPISGYFSLKLTSDLCLPERTKKIKNKACL
jgi:hypothetical protein